MFALSFYDGRSDVAAVPIQSMPVWVDVFGLSPALMTKEALYMVGATLGRVINHDHSNLISGARARVRLEHDILSPVKQAYPPTRFDFGEGTDQTSMLLTFKYERFYGFCRTCGLLEHKPEGCQGPPDMLATGLLGNGGLVSNLNPNPSLSNNLFSNPWASGIPLLK